MRILLLGNHKSYLSKRLKEEFKDSPHSFKSLALGRVVIDYSATGIKLTSRHGTNLLDYDVYFFYGLGHHQAIAVEIAKYLKTLGKVVIENHLALGALPNDKVSLVEQRYLSTWPYRYYFHLSRRQARELTYPIIAKTINGSMGQDLAKINNYQELETFINKNGRAFIIQDFVELKSDYRVLVVGDRALGAVERFVTGDDFLTTRAGGERRQAKLPQAVLDSCVQAVQAKGLSLAGVDILEHQGQYYCFEINSSPQIRIFEKITGINVAAAIRDFLTKEK